MAILGNQLALQRCPHCNVDKPSLLPTGGPVRTADYAGANTRVWRSKTAELKNLIQKAAPVIQGHLDRAESIQKTLR